MQEELIVSQSASGHAEPPETIATVDWFEEVRDRFFKATNLDLKNLTGGEIRSLLELLPNALAYIHNEYDMAKIYETESDGETFVDE